MREQKKIIKWSAAIGCIALTIAVVAEILICIFCLDCKIIDFIINVLVGICASALVSFTIATIQYCVVKDNILRDLWLKIEIYLLNINIFCFKYLPKGSNKEAAITQLEKSETLLNEISELSSEYSMLKLLISKIYFYKKESELKEIIAKLTKCIDNVHIDVSKVKTLNKQMQKEITILSTEVKNSIVDSFECEETNVDKLRDANKEFQEYLSIKTEAVSYITTNKE